MSDPKTSQGAMNHGEGTAQFGALAGGDAIGSKHRPGGSGDPDRNRFIRQ